MSLLFRVSLPTTGDIKLSLSETESQTEARRLAMREQLKRAKHDATPDYVAVVRAIEDYIPHIYNLWINAPDKNLQTSWRMPIRAAMQSVSTETPRQDLTGVFFEWRMVLLTYSLVLCLQAERTLSQHQWKQTTSFLQRAQGVAEYMVTTASTIKEDEASFPVDLERRTLRALSECIGGSIHLLILLKHMHDTFDEPRVESSSHNLLARVARYCDEQYECAAQTLANGRAQSWFSWVRQLCQAFAHRCAAIECIHKQQSGLAIAHTRAALKLIGRDETTSSKVKAKLSKDKNKNKTEQSWDSRLRSHLRDLETQYTSDNDGYLFQPVPTQKELEAQHSWPSGRQVLTAISWTPEQKPKTEAQTYF